MSIYECVDFVVYIRVVHRHQVIIPKWEGKIKVMMNFDWSLVKNSQTTKQYWNIKFSLLFLFEWMNYWTFRLRIKRRKQASVTSFPIFAVDSIAVLVTSPFRFTVECVVTWFSTFCVVFLLESELKRTLDHFSCPCEILWEW